MKTYSNNRRQIIGTINNAGVFRKRVRLSRHLYRNLDAWGIDLDVLSDLLNNQQCKEIRILDLDEKIIYSCQVSDYWTKGTQMSYGHQSGGVQVFLGRKHFTTEKYKPKKKK